MIKSRLVERSLAVRRIGDAIAGQDSFIVVAPPALVARAAQALAELRPKWRAFVDGGTGMVAVTSDPAAIAAVNLLSPSALVVLVSKSVPARELSAVLGERVPDDGSQDIVLLHEGEDIPMAWPMMFIDAIECVDPLVAAQIRLTDRALQS